MNHEAYENEMINGVNRHAGEWNYITFDNETTDTVESVPVKRTGVKTLGRGLCRMIMGLITAGIFGISICDFILVSRETGYRAVAMFFAGVVMLLSAIAAVYGQGIVGKESQGDDK